jgi:hypothetical protein
MKFAKFLLSLPIICLIFLISSFHFVGCTKTTTVHDTTQLIVKDTVTLKDTVTIKDSTCNLSCGLIAYYNFTGGNLNDSSGLNNNIQFNNATKTADRFGNPNNAYLFDGVSTYMTVKNNPSLNPKKITIFSIVKVNGFFTGPCGGNQIISKGYPYDINGFYSLSFFDYASNCGTPDINNESFAGSYGDDIPMGANAGTGPDSVKIKTGKWYYLTYTYDGSIARFYINGQLKDSLVKSVAFTANSNDVYLGKHENPLFQYYLNGVLDEVRIYNRALPAAAVLKLNNLTE